MSQPKHWAYISEKGTMFGMCLLINVYRVGGPWLFKVCLFPVVCFYFVLSGDSRKTSKEYLVRVSKRVPKLKPVTWSLCFAHFWQFALAIIDKFAIWMGKLSVDSVVIHNAKLVDRLVARNKGGIFAISHLGNFEVLSAMSEKHQGVKLTILHHTKHAEKFNRMLSKYSNLTDIELLQVTDFDAALAMKLSEKLDRGEFIAIAADRVPVGNIKATVTCNFFNEPAEFPQGIYMLAYILSAPILMMVCIKQNNIYNIYIESLVESVKVPRAQRNSFIESAAQKFAKRLEYYTCMEPLQWFNLYDFWYRDHGQGK